MDARRSLILVASTSAGGLVLVAAVSAVLLVTVRSWLISDVCDQTHGRHTGKEGKSDDGCEGLRIGLLENCVGIHDFGCMLRYREN
jgi:hypothetical protein